MLAEYETHRRQEDLARLRDWGHAYRAKHHSFDTRVLGYRVELMVKDLERVIGALDRVLIKDAEKV